METTIKIFLFLLLKLGLFPGPDTAIRASYPEHIENAGVQHIKIIFHEESSGLVNKMISDCNNVFWVDKTIIGTGPDDLTSIELEFNLLPDNKRSALIKLLMEYPQLVSIEVRDKNGLLLFHKY